MHTYVCVYKEWWLLNLNLEMLYIKSTDKNDFKFEGNVIEEKENYTS